MTREPCEMQSLVEARHDQRLDEAEAVSVLRHVRTCTACHDQVQQLEALDSLEALAREGASEPLDRMAHRRRRLALLRGASAPLATRAPAPSRWRAVGFAAAAALVVAIVGIASMRSNSAFVQRATLGTSAPSGWIATVAPDRASVTAAANTRFDRNVVRKANVTTDRVRLYDGMLDVQVHELSASERFVVVTGDAEVEVHGTVFSVEVVHDELVRVSVTEGRVEVRHGTEVVVLQPGQTWSPPEIVAANDARSPSLIPTSRHANTNDPEGSRRPPSKPAPPKTAPAQPTQSTASRAFAEAMGKLDSDQYDAASESLRKFARDNPGDARAEDADYLAIVAMQRAGRHAAAAQAARQYLARYPNGARRSWARAIANRTKLEP